MTDNRALTEITSSIVAAYVANNSVSSDAIGSLVSRVHEALSHLGSVPQEAEPVAEKLKPAVNPKRSVFPDHIICLEDGKKFQSMRRHLSVSFGLTPDEYRQKWGLPADYPMVAPDYAARRSQMARKSGLGRKPEITPPAKRKTTPKPKA